MNDVPSSIVKLLMEIGYLAGGYGLIKESEIIFDALCVVRPQSELPLIGLAVTKINANQPNDAARILWDKALQINPESDMAKSFLGLALKVLGLQSESRSILKEVIETDRDVYATEIARKILEEIG